MICKKCGEELPIGVEICPKCGTVVERRKLTPESEARIRETMPDLKEALFNDKITSDTTLSDEVRIKAAVPILREILRLRFPKSQLCKECGHQNPSGVVNCVNCGCSLNSTEEAERDENNSANMVKLDLREENVNFNNVSDITTPEESKSAQSQNSQTSGVYNYVFPVNGGANGAPYSQDAAESNAIAIPYIAQSKFYTKADEKHDKTVNRILAFLLMLLSGGLIYVLTVGLPVMNFSEANIIKPYANGYQLIEAAIYALSGGTIKDAGTAGGIKYCWTDSWLNPFYIDGVGINFGRVVYVSATVILCVILFFAVIMFLMNFVRLMTGKIKQNGKSRCHKMTLMTLIFIVILALVITVFGFFIPQDAEKYPAIYGAIDGLTIGIGIYSSAIVTFIMFILGFFTKKIRRVNVIDNNDNSSQT